MSKISDQTIQHLLNQSMKLHSEFPEVLEHFAKKPFKVIHTGIHPKILGDWNQRGLLIEKPAKNKMHRFSLTELVWVKMIEKMREFKIPLKIIKAAREDLIQKPDNQVNSLLTDPRILEAMVGEYGEEKRESIQTFMNNQEQQQSILGLLSPSVVSGNYLDFLVLTSLLIRTPFSFIIHQDGKGMLLNPIMLSEGAYDSEDTELLLCSSFVAISLTEILAEVLSVAPVEPLQAQLRIITNQEAQVLEALREDDLRSVIIRYDKSNEMDLLEVTKEEKVDKHKRILELMLSTAYQDITIKTAKGNIVFCENTRKVKLK